MNIRKVVFAIIIFTAIFVNLFLNSSLYKENLQEKIEFPKNKLEIKRTDSIEIKPADSIEIKPTQSIEIKSTDSLEIKVGVLGNGINELSKQKDVIAQNVDYFFNKPTVKPTETVIKVYKEKRYLELIGDGKPLGRFKAALGSNPIGHKEREGDRKTPEGKYNICTRNETSQYTRFLGFSYPNRQDAEVSLQNKTISQSVFNSISNAQSVRGLPPWNTPLGGEVGIHGGGNERDWTWGCIAVFDEDILVIWDYTPLKTQVIIYK